MKSVKYIFALALLAIGGMIFSSKAADDRVYDYSVKVGQFDKLNISDNLNVIYHCNPDSTGYAYWRGDSRFDNSFIFSSGNGKLNVQVATEDVDSPDLPTLHLYSDFLTSVTSSSVGSVRIESLSPTATFKATLIGNGQLVVKDVKSGKVDAGIETGNGQLVISGQANEAKFRMLGTGTIQADRLEADVVKCTVLGSGSIGCSPKELLSSKGIGSTKIYYRGHPELKKAGGGKFISLDKEE
ncbi:MAG: hypothetical protein HDS70_02495 [Bacteroidales bacterium]|nr:hypothetical protein [Bacteroidales bacterium]